MRLSTLQGEKPKFTEEKSRACLHSRPSRDKHASNQLEHSYRVLMCVKESEGVEEGEVGNVGCGGNGRKVEENSESSYR